MLGAAAFFCSREHTISTERLTIEPFDLRAPVRHDVVIDRLAWWYFHPREWLKKAALVNEVLVEHVADLLGRDPSEIDP